MLSVKNNKSSIKSTLVIKYWGLKLSVVFAPNPSSILIIW